MAAFKVKGKNRDLLHMLILPNERSWYTVYLPNDFVKHTKGFHLLQHCFVKGAFSVDQASVFQAIFVFAL